MPGYYSAEALVGVVDGVPITAGVASGPVARTSPYGTTVFDTLSMKIGPGVPGANVTLGTNGIQASAAGESVKVSYPDLFTYSYGSGPSRQSWGICYDPGKVGNLYLATTDDIAEAGGYEGFGRRYAASGPDYRVLYATNDYQQAWNWYYTTARAYPYFLPLEVKP
jgi:hypothetical protein